MRGFSLLKGDRRAKDEMGTPIPERNMLTTLEDDDDLDHDYWNIPEDIEDHEYVPSKQMQQDRQRSGAAGLSFPRGRRPKDLPKHVRTRNLDVGLRIGRRPAQNGAVGAVVEEGKKLNSMEEQMRRIQNRQAADAQMQAARAALEQAEWERGLDSIPYLPGRWTEQLHEKVVARVREMKECVDKAAQLYASAEAKDKLPEVEEMRAAAQAAQANAAQTKQAWAELKAGEEALQAAAGRGWPHGQEEFEQAHARVESARECLLEIGEAGADRDGRVRPKEQMLNKRQQRVAAVRKECERRRVKTQVLLDRLAHSKWQVREQAMMDLAGVARKPVPCRVTFLGDLVPMVDEDEWHANSGRGDALVVGGILTLMKDPEPEVRFKIVEALPRVCLPGDPVVLESIVALTKDEINKVKMFAMEALANLAERGDAMVTSNLILMLEDPDASVRSLGARLLPLVTVVPEDQAAIEQVLARLGHRRRREQHPHWITEERDVRLAALQALQLIAPRGHDAATRVVVNLLRQSWALLVHDFTGCARDAAVPHMGAQDDYGESRGPVSLKAQLQSIEAAAPSRCPAKCGEAAAEVRLAAIDVLAAVAVTRADIQAQRLELSKTMNDPRLLLRSGRSTPGTSATNSQSATPFSFSRSSSRPQSGGRSGGDLRLRRLALKAEQDLAYGDLVRHAMVVEALGERLCDMDRGVRWAAAQALVQSVAEVDDVIVMEALAKCLQHEEEAVQALAIDLIKGSALGVCVTPGNVDMAKEICARFGAARRGTRAAAARALVAHCGDGQGGGCDGQREGGRRAAVAFLLPHLWSSDGHVRQDALETLARLVPRGDSEVLREVERGAFEADPAMRMVAIDALARLAHREDNVTRALLEDCLFDQDDAVVCAATVAVAAVAPRGDAAALDVLLSNVADLSDAVRRASVDALTKLSHKGDAAVVSAALRLVDDEDAAVRTQALETLAKVARKGDPAVCGKILARVGALQGDGLRAVADLRELDWASSRSLQFSFG